MAAVSRRGLFGLAGAAAGSLALAACGYRPMYGGGTKGSAVANELAQVSVGVIPNRIGQILRNELERSIAAAGRNQAKSYTLSVAPRLSSAAIGIQEDATATRANLSLAAAYRLIGPDGQPLFDDTITTITSYNILDDQYATVISREDAERRAARDVAQRMITRLSTFFAERRTA